MANNKYSADNNQSTNWKAVDSPLKYLLSLLNKKLVLKSKFNLYFNLVFQDHLFTLTSAVQLSCQYNVHVQFLNDAVYCF